MNSLQGHLLIATPELTDPNFASAVVLIVQHGEEGALGLILNRPLETNLQAVWDQVSDVPCFVDAVLHQGGPCEGPLMVLHQDDSLSSKDILPGVYWSTDKESIEHLASRDNKPARFFVGYAGWAAGQLENELQTGSWLVAPASLQQVFADAETLWDRIVRRISLTKAYPWLDPRLIPDDPRAN